jgi:hypothetical protein
VRQCGAVPLERAPGALMLPQDAALDGHRVAGIDSYAN